MPTENEVTRLMLDVTKSTLENETIWQIVQPPEIITVGTNYIVPIYMECIYKGQRMGLFERRYREYSGEVDSYIWTASICVVFFDGFRRITWEYDDSNLALFNLFQVAKETAGGINQIFSKLLGN